MKLTSSLYGSHSNSISCGDHLLIVNADSSVLLRSMCVHLPEYWQKMHLAMNSWSFHSNSNFGLSCILFTTVSKPHLGQLRYRVNGIINEVKLLP